MTAWILIIWFAGAPTPTVVASYETEAACLSSLDVWKGEREPGIIGRKRRGQCIPNG